MPELLRYAHDVFCASILKLWRLHLCAAVNGASSLLVR
jgi:hypothetical protein